MPFDTCAAARALVTTFDFEFLKCFFVPVTKDLTYALSVKNTEALFTMTSPYLWHDALVGSARIEARIAKYAARGATITHADKVIACAKAVDTWPIDKRKTVAETMKALIANS
jgi:hypothetical protein